jgi:hypothetical protein
VVTEYKTSSLRSAHVAEGVTAQIC